MGVLWTVLWIVALGAAHRSDYKCGAEVLSQVPLIVGANFLPANIHKLENNQINFFDFNSDLTKDPKWKCLGCNTDLLRLLAGKVGAQFWTVFVDHTNDSNTVIKVTLEQIDTMKRLIAKYPDHMRFVDSAEGIDEAFTEGKIGSLLAVDGGQSIDSSLGVLRHYYSAGVRCLSLVRHNNTPWAFAAVQPDTEHRGLTTFGRDVVREMNRLGMLVDLTHSSIQTIKDAIKISQAPVIFSHAVDAPSCTKGYDRILRMLKERHGVMMVSLYNMGVLCDEQQARLDDAVVLINYIRKVAGVESVGIGGAFDGGVDRLPTGLEDVSRFPALFDRLASNPMGEQAWSQEDLRKLAGENFLRVFREVEKVRDNLAYQDPIEEHLRSTTPTA